MDGKETSLTLGFWLGLILVPPLRLEFRREKIRRVKIGSIKETVRSV